MKILKKLTPLFLIVIFLSSCATLERALTSEDAWEIENEIGGDIECSVTAQKYEVSNAAAGEIIKNSRYTSTTMYLYNLNGESYWKITRENDEVAETTFMPKRIHFKVEFEEERIMPSGKIATHYKGRDINTDVKYHIMVVYWNSYKGKFYFLGQIEGEKQVIYSMENYNVRCN